MKLAINGGDPVRKNPFPVFNTISDEERQAVSRVLDSGVLSGYYGSWGEQFYGGPEVQALEVEWAAYFGVKHAVVLNSATSGLYCAAGAIGLEPADEVIVSPYTMSASSVAPLIYNSIPVFSDIEEDYYCLSPEAVERLITPRTRAIIVVDLFGQPYDVDGINAIARQHGLKIIEDCAQAPGALCKNRFAGTLGDVGVYSLNFHKHIHCGEGGVVVTNDDGIAERVRMIRNHGEAVVQAKGEQNIVNLVGFNLRMTEMQAAIARCQLNKLSSIIKGTQKCAEYFNQALSSFVCIDTPKVREDCTHVYYVYPMQYNERVAGVRRNKFVEAVMAEIVGCDVGQETNMELSNGYVEPLYLQPLYQRRIAFGSSGFPWSISNGVDYSKGICPIAEKMHYEKVIVSEFIRPSLSKSDLEDIVTAFQKVWDCRGELRG